MSEPYFRIPNQMRAAVVVLVVPAIVVGTSVSDASAQAVATSAPIADISYEITFTRANGEQRRVSSAMTFTVGGKEPVVLSLPRWTPGAYEIDNFARDVADFEAEQGGSTLSWDKVDGETWRVRPLGVGQITVRFDYVADSLDNAGTWSRPDFLLFNGTNLFLYPEGRGFDFPASVTINTEAAWKVVTGMTSTGPRRYSASNYHDLVDMPFFVGSFDVDSAQISGTWVRFATYPAGSVTGGVRVATWEAFKRAKESRERLREPPRRRQSLDLRQHLLIALPTQIHRRHPASQIQLVPFGERRDGHAVDVAQRHEAREGRQREAVLDAGEV